jgi:hypothetical protein
MPKFTTRPKEQKQKKSPAGAVAQETINKYKPFIEELDKNSIGRLELQKDDEKPVTVRKALIAAGEQIKKYVKIRKPRGVQNILELEIISRKEYMDAKKASKERGEKIAASKAAPKPKAKKKAKAAPKARAKKK